MPKIRRYIVLAALLGAFVVSRAQGFRLAGKVVDAETGAPVEFASIRVEENGLWAITNDKGEFTIKNVTKGKNTLVVQCLGYQKRSWPCDINRDVDNMNLRLSQGNLKLEGVTVVAKRKRDEATTSYTIDRQTLDNQQIVNVADIATLLPGGKTVNPSLTADNRLSLRSAQQEKGNASFGTAIEVDGIRMDNNALSGETMGASTRSISASNIESIEIVTGIPSVEYGD
jgi:outer membrane receptor protein involved in Fe transport